MSPSISLADPGCLAAQLAQVIKLRAPDPTPLHHVDMINYGCVQGKDPFYPDTETGLTNGNRLSRPAMLAGYANAFKSLKSFLCFGLFDPDVHTDSVSGLKVRNVLAQLYFFNIIQSIHDINSRRK